MKRSTEGPAHHIVQVSACLAVVVLWSLVDFRWLVSPLMMRLWSARLHLSVIMAIVVTSVSAISIVIAIAIFLCCSSYHALSALILVFVLLAFASVSLSYSWTMWICRHLWIFVLMFCACFVMWMCGFLILSLVSSQKIVELKKEEEENLYGTLFRAENSLNKQLYTSEQSTPLNISLLIDNSTAPFDVALPLHLFVLLRV